MYFSKDETATKTSKYSNVNRKTVNKLFAKLRQRIVEISISGTPELGEFEIDEHTWSQQGRVCGKKIRGVAGKTLVFGILKRKGKVFINIVKKCRKEDLMPIIKGKVIEGSTVYSDGWKSYDGLILNGYDPIFIVCLNNKNGFAR